MNYTAYKFMNNYINWVIPEYIHICSRGNWRNLITPTLSFLIEELNPLSKSPLWMANILSIYMENVEHFWNDPF
jgi:hypothetical protein